MATTGGTASNRYVGSSQQETTITGLGMVGLLTGFLTVTAISIVGYFATPEGSTEHDSDDPTNHQTTKSTEGTTIGTMDSTAAIGYNSTSSVPVRFPWEPQHVDEDPVIIQKKGPFAHGLRVGPRSSTQVQQLQFLAQMTFANGGLRAPSCLCCI